MKCAENLSYQAALAAFFGVFICFNHLTDQAFIWDQAAVWERKRFSQPALAVNSSSLLSLTLAYICFAIALIILQDTLLWRAHLQITHSIRQPGPFAVLLGQTLKLSFIFSPISHSLGVNRKTSSSCFSQVFLCIFYTSKFEYQVVLFILLLHRGHGDHQCDTDWQKASTIREKGKEEKCAVSVVMSSSLMF